MDAKEFIKKCREDIIFFAEHMIYDESGQRIKLESHQKEVLACKDSQMLLFMGRRLGKSFTLAIKSIHTAIFQKYAKVFIISPTESQAKELANTITGLIERSQLIENELSINNIMEKKFKNGSRITIRTSGGKGNVSSLIGSGASLLIADEIQDIGEELIYKILPVLRGQKGKSQFVVAGTPRTKAGFLYETLSEAQKLWNDGEWQTIEKNKGVFTVFLKKTAYLNEDDEVIKSGTPRITVDELKEDLSMMPLIEFKQEFCLEFMTSISDVYSEELQHEIFYIPKQNIPFQSNLPVVFGLDIGKMRNETVLTIAEVTEDKKLDVKYFKEFPLGTKYESIENYIAYELPRRFPHILRGVVDSTGVGEAVFEAIEKKVKETRKPFPLKSYKFTKETKKALVEGGVAMLERGDVKIVYHKRLKGEMTGYKRQITDSQNTIYEKTAGSDDYVDSLNLCLHNLSLGINFRVPLYFEHIPQSMKKQFGEQSCEVKKPNQKVINQRRRF